MTEVNEDRRSGIGKASKHKISVVLQTLPNPGLNEKHKIRTTGTSQVDYAYINPLILKHGIVEFRLKNTSFPLGIST